MKKLLALFILISPGLNHFVFSQTVDITYDKSSPQQVYAATTLQTSLEKKGYAVKETSADYPPAGSGGQDALHKIILSLNTTQLSAEAFSILPAGKKITITGGDERGLIYGCLSLAEDINNGIALKNIKAKMKNHFFRFVPLNLIFPGILTVIVMHSACMMKPAVIPFTGNHFLILWWKTVSIALAYGTCILILFLSGQRIFRKLVYGMKKK